MAQRVRTLVEDFVFGLREWELATSGPWKVEILVFLTKDHRSAYPTPLEAVL